MLFELNLDEWVEAHAVVEFGLVVESTFGVGGGG